jgi:choline dehydrogenase-like flavoprotein
VSQAAGEVRVFAQYDADFTEEVDVVVVGSGPGGAVAARELACAGIRVALLEEGPPFTPRDFELDGAISMARTMREGGLRMTRGTVMPTMQGIALGGGSLVNSAICNRAPDFVLDGWCNDFELEHMTRADLDPHFDAVGKFLGIAPTPENVLGKRNLLFKEGCDRLGYASEPVMRNVVGCRGSGECFTGCRTRAKQSMDVSYVPAAIRAGAKVLTSVRVEQVLTDGARATGVAGRVVAPFTGKPSHRFRVDARTVVLAAGCMATPVILEKSGNLANRSRQVGANLQFHPGIAIMGIFPDDVHPAFGATQGYQSRHFLRDGFKLETLWAPPSVLAVRLPGSGLAFKNRLADFPNAAIWDAIASCNRSLGRVRPRSRSMDPVVSWRLHPDDVRILAKALWTLAEVFFAAGARSVVSGVNGVPDEFFSLDEARVLTTHPLRDRDLIIGGNHAFCTTRMHGNPDEGVVDEYGRCHDVENLYIADTGVFPGCPSVNPMWTAMALAHRTATRISEQF